MKPEDLKNFEKVMIAKGYSADLFDGFYAEGEFAYYDRKANEMYDVWLARAPLAEALEKLATAHKFNTSILTPAAVHAICFNALQGEKP